ncbi:MAG: hypothetical protein AB8G05_27680 [Oligoflexales bacterium]
MNQPWPQGGVAGAMVDFQSGLSEEIKNLGYYEYDSIVEQAFVKGNLESLIVLKRWTTSAQTNASLAKNGADDLFSRHEFLNGQLWHKIAQGDETVADLVAIAEGKLAIGKFAATK